MKQFILLFTMCIAAPMWNAAANPYTAKHCGDTRFSSCYVVRQGETWEILFPNPARRRIAMELSRQTVPLRGQQWVVVPPEIVTDTWYLEQSPLPRNRHSLLSHELVFSPRDLAWGLYVDGNLKMWGAAAGGREYCENLGRTCRTPVGTFKVIATYGATGSLARPIGCAQCEPIPFFTLFHLSDEIERAQVGVGVHPGDINGEHLSHGCVRTSYQSARYIHEFYENLPPGSSVTVLQY